MGESDLYTHPVAPLPLFRAYIDRHLIENILSPNTIQQGSYCAANKIGYVLPKVKSCVLCTEILLFSVAAGTVERRVKASHSYAFYFAENMCRNELYDKLCHG